MKSENEVGFKPCHSRRVVRSNTEKTMVGKQYCQYIAKDFISGEPRVARAPAGPREWELLQCGHTGWKHDHHHYHHITSHTRPYPVWGRFTLALHKSQVIDLINPDTFNYTSSPLVRCFFRINFTHEFFSHFSCLLIWIFSRGGFNWGLNFKWESLPAGTLSK